MNPQFLSSNNNQIHFVDKNSDGEIAIVFIHGRCLSLKSWERQMDSKILSPFRLVAFDLPGHGLSSHSANPLADYSIKGFIRALSDVIDQLQLTKYVLAGYSLGGHIALEAMPNLPGCLGVFSMTLPITKPMQFGEMYLNGELAGKVYTENPAQRDVSAYAKTLLKDNAAEFPDFLESDFYKTDPQVHTGIVQSIITGDYDDETEIIRTSKLPIAIAAGSQEQVHNLAYLNDLALPVWRGKPLFIPDAGHLLQWENPEAVNQLLRSFADEAVTPG